MSSLLVGRVGGTLHKVIWGAGRVEEGGGEGSGLLPYRRQGGGPR